MPTQPTTLTEARASRGFTFWGWMDANNNDGIGGKIVEAKYPPLPECCVVEDSLDDILAYSDAYDADLAARERDLQFVFDYRISRGMPILKGTA